MGCWQYKIDGKSRTLAWEGITHAKSLAPQGSILGDFCSIWWCAPCALCQLKRDINRRREQGIFW